MVHVKFRYTSTYSIKGIALPPDGVDTELVVDSKNTLRAVLTSQPNTHTSEGDQSLGVARLMLQGLIGGSEPATDEFRQRVTNAAEEIKVAREKEFGRDPFLVVIGEGEVPSFIPTHERDFEDFIVCFDGADKSEIRARFHSQITALMAKQVYFIKPACYLVPIGNGLGSQSSL